MSFDTSAPLNTYKTVFNGFRNEINNIKGLLELSFNFGRNSTDINFHDFWNSLIDPINLPTYDFNIKLDNIIKTSQISNDLISNNIMNMLGMVSQLDNYICFASDSLSRAIDTSWAFGNGSVYKIVYGEYDIINGEYVILKKGLEFYKSELGKIILNCNGFINDMDTSKSHDLVYLTNYRDNKFVPEIKKALDIIKDCETEIDNLMVLSEDCNKVLMDWLPTCFKMLTTVSLTFNLGNKIMKIGDKALIDGSPITQEVRIGMSVAKFWKNKVLQDMSNRGDCMTEAILQGFRSISAPGFLEAFIDKTWENMIIKG